jgi:hypothetical protein
MGGGKTNSSASNTSSDNDIMASDSAVVIGEGGSLTELGMGATMLEAGASNVESNEGYIIGDGADINSGVQIGHGSSYVVNSMTDKTADLLDNAMTLMYANTENVLEAHAAQIGTIDSPQFMNPTNDGLPTNPKSDPSTKNNTPLKIAGGATLLLLAALAMKGRPKQ